MKRSKNRYYSRPGNDEPVVITPRPCMCCRQTFESEGIHNRLCGNCRGKNVGPDAAFHHGASGGRKWVQQ